MLVELGIARVDRDGGFRIAWESLSELDGPLIPPRVNCKISWPFVMELSAAKAASKYGRSVWVKIGSGTRTYHFGSTHE
jgi:hypothetical protein